MRAARSWAILSRLSPPSTARIDTDFCAEHWKSKNATRFETGFIVSRKLATS